MHLQEVAKVVRVEVGGYRLVLIPAILWRRGGLKRLITVLTPHDGGRCDPQPLPCLRVSQSQSSALTDQCRPASGTPPRDGGIAGCTSQSTVGFTDLAVRGHRPRSRVYIWHLCAGEAVLQLVFCSEREAIAAHACLSCIQYQCTDTRKPEAWRAKCGIVLAQQEHGL